MTKINLSLFSMVLIVMGTCSCSPPEEEIKETPANPLFTLLDPTQSGVDFRNELTESVDANIFLYQYFYNGGGVAVGDLNNDGLEDIYFSGNMTQNKLYLNKGQLAFQDITLAANVGGRPRSWSTGVAMVDINGDGWLDLYVCYSGDLAEESRRNQLFVNQGADKQGIPYFKEMAAEYGLDSPSYSTSAAFFDHDGDGDLDAVLLNHHIRLFRNLDEVSFQHILSQKDALFSTRLMENRAGKFVDITAEAGWDESPLSYGLGLSISDFDADGWPDVFVGNDYSAADHLYINQRDGTYQDELQSHFDHNSLYSMGSDAADINNDGLVDLVSLDMLPEDNKRQKLLFMPDNYSHFNLFLQAGLHYQYMRNMLQLNNGDGTFSEIGQLAGISNTDWSWAPLWADFDQDGHKDLFVTNGFLHDFTNLDFIKYRSSFFENGGMSKENLMALIKEMPSSEVKNYVFRNSEELRFESKGVVWGMDEPSNSNGAAYADLDNDGDLDLVTNNINQAAFIYENKRNERPEHQWLQVELLGAGQNTAGIGAKVTVYQHGSQQVIEQMPYRGYQSSVSRVITFGLKAGGIDSLKVVWPNGNLQHIVRPPANQRIRLLETESDSGPARSTSVAKKMFAPLSGKVGFTHRDKPFNDYKRQPLLAYPLSDVGPIMEKADVNGDGRLDVLVGGGKGQSAKLLMAMAEGDFQESDSIVFENSAGAVDTDALFFDADGDGDLDLYLASGGYHDFAPKDERMQDRFYENRGNGSYVENSLALPDMPFATGAVAAWDLNGDGALDIFVGGAAVPGRHPESSPSVMLINDGTGKFNLAASEDIGELSSLHLVRQATAADVDQDGKVELIVAGEWMPIEVFSAENGTVKKVTNQFFEQEYKGIWRALLVEDLDGDGQVELLAGNLGWNTQLKATDKEPAELLFKDFDGNGAIDPILSFYIQGKSYPYVSRDELLEQMSNKRTAFSDYASYADAGVEEIFSKEELQGATKWDATTFETMLFHFSEGKFQKVALPVEVQYSPVYSITSLPDEEGKCALWLGGNMHQARIKTGNIAANHGMLLVPDSSNAYRYIPQSKSGFGIKGDVRSSLFVHGQLWVGQRNAPITRYIRSIEK